MNRELAIAIAANEAGVTTEQLEAAFDRYAHFISTCPSCEGTGSIKVAHATNLKWPNATDLSIGHEVQCFVCGGTGKDSRYATWICRERIADCNPDDPHTGPETFCGWSIAT